MMEGEGAEGVREGGSDGERIKGKKETNSPKM